MVIEFLFFRQVIIAMLFFSFLFMPWNKKRDKFVLRLTIGIISITALWEVIRRIDFDSTVQLVLCAGLIFGLVSFCFESSMLQNLFITTSAYTVQFISSKMAYMLLIFFVPDTVNLLVVVSLLLASTLLLGSIVYIKYTLKYSRIVDFKFDSVTTVYSSAIFLIVAARLSVVVENYLDTNAAYYRKMYATLNLIYVLFGQLILMLEYNNINNKELESENKILSHLLEADKEQYEQAQRDMEKINIRYHDLKQLFANADEDERNKLEEEMAELNLSFYTGNKAVDVTLTKKAIQCNKEKIQLVCSVDASCLERMKHYHIYSMLGNALDNAIECLVQVRDAERKVIFLDIHKERNMAVIKMENYTPLKPIYNNKRLITTKQDNVNHGFGIKSIQNTAEIYGGIANTFVENNIFYLLITIPLKEKIVLG